jgi:hypothetical protein
LLQAFRITVDDSRISFVHTNRTWFLDPSAEFVEQVIDFSFFGGVNFSPTCVIQNELTVDRLHASVKHQPGRNVANHVRR